jgi:hypothetical protein
MDEIDKQIMEAETLIKNVQNQINKEKDLQVKNMGFDWELVGHLAMITNLCATLMKTIECVRSLSKKDKKD